MKIETLENAINLVFSTTPGDFNIYLVDDVGRVIKLRSDNYAIYEPLLIRFIKFKFSAKTCFIRVLGAVLD